MVRLPSTSTVKPLASGVKLDGDPPVMASVPVAVGMPPATGVSGVPGVPGVGGVVGKVAPATAARYAAPSACTLLVASSSASGMPSRTTRLIATSAAP